MAESFKTRTIQLIGEEKVDFLANQRVLIAGVGGVGSYVAEALTRAGVGHLTLIDPDVIDVTNINRQLLALHSTIGQKKVEVAAKRLHDINPALSCTTLDQRLVAGELDVEGLPDAPYDYVVDCIDDVAAKVALIRAALRQSIPVISSMGTGNRLDNCCFEVTDISKTCQCHLAKAVRLKLRKQGIHKGVKVVYACKRDCQVIERQSEANVPGTISYVPGTCGLLLAGEVIRDFLKHDDRDLCSADSGM